MWQSFYNNPKVADSIRTAWYNLNDLTSFAACPGRLREAFYAP